MRPLTLFVIAFGFSLGALACKTKCADPVKITEDDDGITPEQRRAEEKALAKQPNLCSELRTVEIHTGTRVSVKVGERTHAVAKVTELPREHMRVVDGLRVRLRAYRDHWRLLHTTEEFDGRAKVMLDPSIGTVRGVSILMTVVFAGYRTDSVQVGDVHLDNVEWWYPKPPSLDAPIERNESLCLDQKPGGLYTLRFDPERVVPPPPEAVAVAALPDAIARACKNPTPCADVLGIEEPDTRDLTGLVRVARTALGAPPFATKKPKLHFRTHVPRWTTSLGVADETKAPCEKRSELRGQPE